MTTSKMEQSLLVLVMYCRSDTEAPLASLNTLWHGHYRPMSLADLFTIPAASLVNYISMRSCQGRSALSELDDV